MNNRANDIFSVKGKVAIITGGAGFLGMEYTKALARAGARVAVFDNTSEDILAKKTRALAPLQKKNALFLSVDITDSGEVARAVNALIMRWKRIDILINNAALNPIPESDASKAQWMPYEDYPLELWRKEIDVGLTGMLIMTQTVAPHMIRQKSGSIINISSIYGVTGPDPRIYDKGKFKSIAYATIKGAVLNFTRAWAARLMGTGIRANTLTLGGVFAHQPAQFVEKYNSRTMIGRMGKKDEFNGAIIFLSSDASLYMTGANLIIDGGWSAW